LISHLSLLKRAALSAPFLQAFDTQGKLQTSFAATNVPSQQEQAAPEQGELMQVRPREDEAIYIQASHDRVTVVFSTVFKEETDREFGKIFLQVRACHLSVTGADFKQEFVDARRQQSMQNAPQVMYSSREPPLEIRHLPGLKTHENVGYVTFG
jgi:actin related protein 2/3 complex subunit 2